MKDHICIRLGKAIKVLRIKRSLTQERLADLIKTNYKYMQRIEGKTPPDLRITTIERIAKALKVKPSDLLK